MHQISNPLDIGIWSAETVNEPQGPIIRPFTLHPEPQKT